MNAVSVIGSFIVHKCAKVLIPVFVFLALSSPIHFLPKCSRCRWMGWNTPRHPSGLQGVPRRIPVALTPATSEPLIWGIPSSAHTPPGSLLCWVGAEFRTCSFLGLPTQNHSSKALVCEPVKVWGNSVKVYITEMWGTANSVIRHPCLAKICRTTRHWYHPQVR